jgi:hypothetical protein
MYTNCKRVSSVLRPSRPKTPRNSIVVTSSTQPASQTGLSCRTSVPCAGRIRVTTRSFSLKNASRMASVPPIRMRSSPSRRMSTVFGRGDHGHFFLAAYRMPEQCSATTRQGVQCKRNSRTGTNLCGLHTTTSSGQCPVCLDSMRAQTRTLACGHTFHLRCLERWKRMSRTCPMCRVPFDQPSYKVRVSIQRTSDGETATHTYATTNVAALVSTFGIDPFTDTRFVTDIFFDIDANESVEEVLHELGLRMPVLVSSSGSEPGTARAPSGPPDI